MLDNVEFIMNMKFQKLLMTVCRDMDKNIKIPPIWGFFPHLWPRKIFFQKLGSVTFVPLWCTIFMQKIRKKQWAVFEIFKDRLTDALTGWPTDQWNNMGDYYGPHRVNPGSKNEVFWSWVHQWWWGIWLFLVGISMSFKLVNLVRTTAFAG